MSIIKTYNFGKMTIGEQNFSADLIIYPDGRIQDSWWRRKGHRLIKEDIEELIASEPEVIVAGMGASGFMRPDDDLAGQLADLGIKLICQPTSTAKDTYNKLQEKQKVGGCFHLTC